MAEVRQSAGTRFSEDGRPLGRLQELGDVRHLLGNTPFAKLEKVIVAQRGRNAALWEQIEPRRRERGRLLEARYRPGVARLRSD